jgi:hypothetical protein
MKNTIILLIFNILIFVSCSPRQKPTEIQNFESKVKYLINDSIKFWEVPANNMLAKYLGLYFSSDGTCDEYYVDMEGKRQFYYPYPILYDPLRYKICKDSLFVIFGDCKLERCKHYRFKIEKLTQDTLDVILNFNGGAIPYSYFTPKDQHTKPKFFYELYPNDKSKWPYGTY